jgi:DnaJ-class molecular chaperone
MAEREWFDKDYYKVLGLTSSATDKEITRAYRKLAKEFHPDTHPGSEEKFKEISVAYDVLGDDAKRKEYDEVRRLGPFKRATSLISAICSADSLGTRGASAVKPNAAPT